VGGFDGGGVVLAIMENRKRAIKLKKQ